MSEDRENADGKGENADGKGENADGNRKYTDEEIRDMSQKELRKRFPSGWMELTRVETLVLLVDVLLEAPPTREFTANELAEKAGLNRRSVETHVDSLVELGVVDELADDRDGPRFTVNERSPIKRRLDDLNVTVQRVRGGGLSKSLPKPDDAEVTERHGNDVVRGRGDTDESSVLPGPGAFPT